MKIVRLGLLVIAAANGPAGSCQTQNEEREIGLANCRYAYCLLPRDPISESDSLRIGAVLRESSYRLAPSIDGIKFSVSGPIKEAIEREPSRVLAVCLELILSPQDPNTREERSSVGLAILACGVLPNKCSLDPIVSRVSQFPYECAFSWGKLTGRGVPLYSLTYATDPMHSEVHDSLERWNRDNLDFLYWDAVSNLLVVDEEAKRRGEPVDLDGRLGGQ